MVLFLNVVLSINPISLALSSPIQECLKAKLMPNVLNVTECQTNIPANIYMFKVTESTVSLFFLQFSYTYNPAFYFNIGIKLRRHISFFSTCSRRKKSPYSELFWSAFFPDFPAFGLNTERYVNICFIRLEMHENSGSLNKISTLEPFKFL